jgi:hypothetical protein
MRPLTEMGRIVEKKYDLESQTQTKLNLAHW